MALVEIASEVSAVESVVNRPFVPTLYPVT